MSIKRSIDFAAIDKLRRIFQRMDLPLLQIGRINYSFPVFVGKPSGADKNAHIFRYKVPISYISREAPNLHFRPLLTIRRSVRPLKRQWMKA
jgi:hypothetical protein